MVNKVLLAILLALPAAAFAKDPQGIWFTEDRGGVVQVGPCGEALCGVIVGLTPNPDGRLPNDFRGNPQCRSILLKDLRLQDDRRWHGTVTNPEDGRIYSAQVWIGEDGNFRLRGYIGLSLFGATQSWTAFHGRLQPDCHFS